MKYETIFRANKVNGNIIQNAEVTQDGRHYCPTDDFWNILIDNGYCPYSSNLSENVDFVDEDVQLWINSSEQSALAWIGPKYLETMDDHLATDIVIPDSIPGIAKVDLVYIVCKRWVGDFFFFFFFFFIFILIFFFFVFFFFIFVPPAAYGGFHA